MEIPMSIDRLLGLNLRIPDYQRPYRWGTHNIAQLLEDIGNALSGRDRYGGGFRYRVGTVILHEQTERSKKVYDIVDGQQRIISFALLKYYLDESFRGSILRKKFGSKDSLRNIHDNFRLIRDWFQYKRDEEDSYREALDRILEAIVISVEKESEAFQLFDSQNTRGKPLAPHDLLKAYHLREMKGYRYEMEDAVTKWEAHSPEDIRVLFDDYLFPVMNWSRRIKNRPFTAKEIDAYKGIREDSSYTYARRAGRAAPFFQIAEPFLAGNDFFEMVEHYLTLKRNIETEMRDNGAFREMYQVLQARGSTGIGYARNLFYCALLSYYDRFHNFDEKAVKKLFSWAYMLRVDMEALGNDSINKYAVGENDGGRYTNGIPMFFVICTARTHAEVANLPVKVLMEKAGMNEEREGLLVMLKKLNGYDEK